MGKFPFFLLLLFYRELFYLLFYSFSFFPVLFGAPDHTQMNRRLVYLNNVFLSLFYLSFNVLLSKEMTNTHRRVLPFYISFCPSDSFDFCQRHGQDLRDGLHSR